MSKRAPLPPFTEPVRGGVLEIEARCVGCGWESFARNGVGTGALHARRTGHEVHVTTTRVVLFNSPPRIR